MSVQPSREWKQKSRWNQCEPAWEPAVTARQISESKDFLAACAALDVKPSVRQARDYRRRIGRFARYGK